MSATSLSLRDATSLATAVLMTAGVDEGPAFTTAAAVVAAEADGLAGHGLSRLPSYADQVRAGKVDGRAVPFLEWTGQSSLRVDAGAGFAFPAIARGLEAAAARAPQAGVAVVAIRNSHHPGVMGHHVELLAEHGLIGIGFSNVPATADPANGSSAASGTNPIAFAAPRWRRPPLVLDVSPGELSWGQAAQPEEAPQGATLATGDARGAAFVLMLETMAAALTGSQFGFEASSFLTTEGKPPRVGQLFVVLHPQRLGGPGFLGRLEILLSAVLGQAGTDLPAEPRLAARQRARTDGIPVDADLLADLHRRAGRG